MKGDCARCGHPKSWHSGDGGASQQPVGREATGIIRRVLTRVRPVPSDKRQTACRAFKCACSAHDEDGAPSPDAAARRISKYPSEPSNRLQGELSDVDRARELIRLSETAQDTGSDLTDPSYEEFIRLQPILETLKAALVEQELHLQTVEAELGVFNMAYMRVVGRVYVELDALKARIAECRARDNPRDSGARDEADEARRRAEETAGQARRAEEGSGSSSGPPDEALRKLYREVAKSVHPDLACDEADRERRTTLMKDANGAFARRDEAVLREVFAAGLSDQFPRSRALSRLDQAKIEKQRCDARLRGIQEELAALHASFLARLKERVEEAEQEGRDLLAEIAKAVEMEVEAARETLRTVGAE